MSVNLQTAAENLREIITFYNRGVVLRCCGVSAVLAPYVVQTSRFVYLFTCDIITVYLNRITFRVILLRLFCTSVYRLRLQVSLYSTSPLSPCKGRLINLHDNDRDIYVLQQNLTSTNYNTSSSAIADRPRCSVG